MNWSLCLLLLLFTTTVGSTDLHLTTGDEGYVTVIQGFATQLQCFLNTCSTQVLWYKDDVLIINGTHVLTSNSTEEPAYKLQHKIDVDYEKTCTGSCSDKNPCADGLACVDNQCCACSKEEFTLVLKNLTFEDAGRYRCQIANMSELLEFQLEVLESGLRGGFHENISYDHSQCCQEKGISPLCRAMCKPSEMAEYQFDPTSCKTDDYKNFLSCATDNGTRNHVHCCKTQLVPSFCYDFCAGDFKMLRRSHRLCLYYLPEIFECYNRAYLPYPDAPEDVQVNTIDHDQLSVCWSRPPVHPSNKDFPVTHYTVSYKEVPNFTLFGGDIGIPFLNGDYTNIGDLDDGDADYEEPTTLTRRKRGSEDEQMDEFDLIDSIVSIRKKRSTIVLMASEKDSNTTTVREFAFKHVNTTNTCATLSDLRSATRYIIMVTAINDYGSSVPSVRAIASTNIYNLKNNGSVPDAAECCKVNKVSDECAKKMCLVDKFPDNLDTISLATTCKSEWPKVSPCIADQRNHTDCCVRKGVSNECLPICAGSTDQLDSRAILCLTIDMQTIYTCLRQGYETHPSAPVNVSVHDVTETTAEFRWEEPDTNAHLVETFTLFLRKNEHSAQVHQIINAVSPHTELGLEPDTEYTVSVQSNSDVGTSLPSTAIIFRTKPAVTYGCVVGEPLLVSEDRLFLCNEINKCPIGYQCTDNGEGDSFCCQTGIDHSDADFQECCEHQKIAPECMSSCYFNATLPETCKDDLNKWVQCASQGSDHSRCCAQSGVPKECQFGCRHPFQVPDTCISSVDKLTACFAGRHNGVPLPVKNVGVSLIQHDSVTVTWLPTQTEVDYFTVFVYSNASLYNATNSTYDVIRIENLKPLTEYSIEVVAFNQYGRSPPSWNTSFTTLPDTIIAGDRPKQPENLHVVWNHGVRVNVSWDAVTKRRNGDDVVDNIEYTVFYVDAENSAQWTTIRSNTTWAVLSDLRRDGLYSVHVSASENKKSSRSSSVITIIAQNDFLGLPEPKLIFSPDHSDGVYPAGQKLIINCSVYEKSMKDGKLNLDLTAGPNSAVNEPGQPWVSLEVDTDSTLDTAACAVTDADGRQNVAMKHILVKFGPVATMEKTKIRAFDDQSASILCTVKGFPTPNIRFIKKGDTMLPRFATTSVKLVKMNTYVATLHIPRVVGNDGHYICVADRDGNRSMSEPAELIISRDVLPVNPRMILSCCEDEKIEGDCLMACSIGKPPESVGNCTQYAKQLLQCAEDARDHSDCCQEQNVPRPCLPLCSGDSHIDDFDCSEYAVKIMSCFVKGHEGSPEPVSDVAYEVLEKGKIKVKWEDKAPADNYQYYAVYYKKSTADEDEYRIERTLDKSLVLDIEQGKSYDIGVVAANAFGHSPLVFIDVDQDRPEPTKEGRSGWKYVFIIFPIILIVTALFVIARKNELPFSKFFGRQAVPSDHPCVAFENPAYVSGNEIEIRGLGRQEWQSPDLQAPTPQEGSSTGSGGNDYRNGMRYSKLEST